MQRLAFVNCAALSLSQKVLAFQSCDSERG